MYRSIGSDPLIKQDKPKPLHCCCRGRGAPTLRRLNTWHGGAAWRRQTARHPSNTAVVSLQNKGTLGGLHLQASRRPLGRKRLSTPTGPASIFCASPCATLTRKLNRRLSRKNIAKGRKKKKKSPPKMSFLSIFHKIIRGEPRNRKSRLVCISKLRAVFFQYFNLNRRMPQKGRGQNKTKTKTKRQSIRLRQLQNPQKTRRAATSQPPFLEQHPPRNGPPNREVTPHQ